MRSRTSAVLVAVDARTRDVAGAEHLAHLLGTAIDDALGRDDVLVTTHMTHGHTAVAASWRDGGDDDDSAWPARLAALLADELGVVVTRGTQERSAGPADLRAGARDAAAQHSARSAGRLVRFAGRTDIERVLTVREVLAASTVDEVTGLAGTVVTPDTVVDLTEWARPVWREGRSELVVQQTVRGLVPFESRHQIACCADH